MLEIRLGGIYALERIARDSARDHWPVMEILTAFVREHRKWDPSAPTPRTDFRADVRAALSVIVRRRRENETPKQRLNLTRCDLRGLQIVDAHIEGAFFSDSNLDHAKFTGSAAIGAEWWNELSLKNLFKRGEVGLPDDDFLQRHLFHFPAFI